MKKYEPVRNEALFKAMQEIRRSNRAVPHRNRAKYSRKAKHRPTY